MLAVLRFWKARGVDGFRVDAMRQVLKDLSLRDNPPAPGYEGPPDAYASLIPEFTTDLDEVQEVVAAIRAGDRRRAPVHGRGDRADRAARALLRRRRRGRAPAVQLPPDLASTGAPEAIAALVERYEAALPDGAWPNWVLGNHDQPRVASRVGAGQARVGGDAAADAARDADALLRRRARDGRRRGAAGAGRRPRRPRPGALADAVDGRAGARASAPTASSRGCRSATRRVNVEAQEADPRSMLALHRRLLALRRASDDLAGGRLLDAGGGRRRARVPARVRGPWWR